MAEPPPIFVRVLQGTRWENERSFTHAFTIGRAPECDVVVDEPAVSRHHAEVRWRDGRWQLIDLRSRNGTFLNGMRVQEVPLPVLCRVTLGENHAVFQFSIGHSAEALQEDSDRTVLSQRLDSVTRIVQKLEQHEETADVGPQTNQYDKALKRIKQRQSRRHYMTVGVIGVVLLAVGGIALNQWKKVDAKDKQIETFSKTAEDIFYTMKRLELQVAQLDEVLSKSTHAKELKEIQLKQQEIKSLQSKYDRFIKELGLYANMSEQDRAVLRVARLFGECDATVPQDFLDEVNKYIQKWKTTERLQASMQRALSAGYTGTISNAMFTNNLAPHFFYLALQESGFDHKAIGPKTRLGYAKGMWQFIPLTAKEFGLRPGPLLHEPRFDPDDDRFNVKKATEAAAKYIKRLYLTDAQASGLLVIASYNWGEGNVVKMIRQLPKNPQERNFWQLLKKFKIPQETYDYVFYIISAAVIGENPQLFGFNFPPPFHNTSISTSP
ncbi:MAG: FHA domain-containing protein [Nitrospira sp.]|nr:FHA domain-containing protein [Nitrospira sp.]MDH4243260.1 FHA domain-containing protein [Nitrospira sp.]MDH4358088.1 FHA domain-containing protein [Nitrospira sp.]MDH5317395.1 FHA domain-containing protein [Nitrospira sp.]